MHLAHIAFPQKWKSLALEAGTYVVEDHNAAEILWEGRGFGQVRLEAASPPAFGGVVTMEAGQRLLVVRVGGFGDLLWLNSLYPAIREMGIKVYHCCFSRYADVLRGFVDGVVPYPLLLSDARMFNQVAWLENSIEGSPCKDGEHPTERLAGLLGVSLPERLAAYKVFEDERAAALAAFPRTDGVHRVCVQIEASGGPKSYQAIFQAMAHIARRGREIVVVGKSRRPWQEKVPPGVFDCTQEGFSIRQSIAMLSTCDAVLAPDSVMSHAGGALGIPVVGLYGPFDGASYLKSYPGAIPLQGRMACSPCWWHPRGSEFPPGQPCEAEGNCLALNKITPEFVAMMVERALGGSPGDIVKNNADSNELN